MKKTQVQELPREDFLFDPPQVDIDRMRGYELEEQEENIKRLRTIRKSVQAFVWILGLSAVLTLLLVILDACQIPGFDISDNVILGLIGATFTQTIGAIVLSYTQRKI